MTKYVQKNELTDDERKQILETRIKTSTNLGDLIDSSFVIEAATENTVLKQDIFKQLSDITKPGSILATNTSSISITLLGAKTKQPENVIGMHFMNPVPVMKLVEVIRGLATSDETYQRTFQLATAMKKECTLSKDSPGFIANRILMPYINEAIQTLHEGIAGKEDIDKTMKLGTNVPMGPLTLADFIGLDTCLAIMRVLHTEFGDSKYRPSPLLVKMVEAGWLGKKTGRGFYEYK
jgi:3-hydroxybutyryl-CoA dehydrogenase